MKPQTLLSAECLRLLPRITTSIEKVMQAVAYEKIARLVQVLALFEQRFDLLSHFAGRPIGPGR